MKTMENTHDSFTAYAIVAKGTSSLLHWVVYHRREDAVLEAQQWLEETDYDIREIKRRMRPLHVG